MKDKKKKMSEVMSELAKLGHKKKPRSSKFYQNMNKKRWQGHVKKSPGRKTKA